MSFRIRRGEIIGSPEKIQKKQNIDKGFKEVLDSKVKEEKKVKLSSHAQERLLDRQIHLHKGDMGKIEDAIDKLDEKGAKESLMIYKDMALIASIKNRTIITAMGRDDLDIVTNIDSTMIVK